MSPEAASGSVAGAASDVYSLGAVLYYLTVGAPPFDEVTAGALLVAHLNQVPTRPSVALGRDVPSDLEELIVKCLEKRPTDRFATMADLSRALRACGDAGEWQPRASDASSRPHMEHLDPAHAETVEAAAPDQHASTATDPR